MEKTKVTIYTDGACSGNPGPGGYGAIIMVDDNKKEIFGAQENTTNNRMELMAAIEALKVLKRPCIVTLYSDSAYLVNAYNNNWINSWKKNGWKNASKEPVKNVDLWQKIEELRTIHDVTFVKVKGHADNEFNNRCDELAVGAIKKLQNGELKETRENNIKRVFGNLPILETERLKLRLFKKEDVNGLFEYCSDEQVTMYMPFDTYTNIQDAVDRINYCINSYTNIEKPILWAIENKQTGKLIGGVDFVKWDEENNNAEIGYILNRKYWNQGVMTEAVKRVIQFGFDNMELNRIEIYCDVRNIASSRVAEKCGLKYEGTMRKKLYTKGEYINLKVYSILKEEYEKNA